MIRLIHKYSEIYDFINNDYIVLINQTTPSHFWSYRKNYVYRQALYCVEIGALLVTGVIYDIVVVATVYLVRLRNRNHV